MSRDLSSVKDLLKTKSFLRQLSPGDLDKVAAIAEVRPVKARALLYHEGEVCESLHIVSSGLIALDMCMPRQGCTRILTVGPGEIVGWSALFADATMAVRATAAEDSTSLASVFASGKAGLTVRARHEHVDQDGHRRAADVTDHQDAHRIVCAKLAEGRGPPPATSS